MCGLLYARGEPTDERLHVSFHRAISEGVRFAGWHAEQVVRRDERYGRVVLVRPGDPPKHLKKVGAAFVVAGCLQLQLRLSFLTFPVCFELLVQ